MNYNQSNPNFTNFSNSMGQGVNPAPFPQIPYKPITFEKLSNLIGVTYNLSAIENINTIPLPRGSGEQQIFFVNNDEKIYARSFDNSIGIVGYKQDYVQKLENELKEAQSQLQEIFNEIIKSTEEQTNNLEVENSQNQMMEDFNDRLTKLEDLIKNLAGGINNGPKESNNNLERISEVA